MIMNTSKNESSCHELLDIAVNNYVDTGTFICPMEKKCSAIIKACDNCAILDLVDTLGIVRDCIYRVADKINNSESI